MSDAVILEGRDLWKEYRSGVTALAGVTLQVFQGEFLAIVGPSGAGKSTLLHVLGGLDRPTQGQVTLKTDISLYEVSESERAIVRNQEIGFVFQLYHLLGEFSALENVVFPCLIAGGSRKQAYQRGEELLRKVGLLERMHHKPSHLSGGEQQRVALARALMNRPKILLCDEPTGNLDSKTGALVKELLWQLAIMEKQTVVIVTHDPEVAEKASRLIHMKDGKIETTATITKGAA